MQRKKARWDHEELVLLARNELELRAAGVRNINQRLVEKGAGRSLDAFKGVRKSEKYKELVQSLQRVTAGTNPIDNPDEAELLERTTFSPPREHAEPMPEPMPETAPEPMLEPMPETPPEPMPEATTEPMPVDWSTPLIDAIEDLGVQLDGINIRTITPGEPTPETRQQIDAEYTRWVPTRPRTESRFRPQQPLPVRPRQRRRALYARTQRSFKNSRKRCASNILSGEWRTEPNPLTLDEQEPFWREIFQRPSVVDDRQPQPVGPIQWGILSPITTYEVTESLSGMTDGAPGPDGWTLTDVKALPSDELAAHYNLWLLAGYQPAALRRGETVLIPKQLGTRDPAKHRPITIADIVIRCFHRILAKRFECQLPFNTRQKAFQSGDGAADSIWLLQSIIRQQQRDIQPLNIAFIDVLKAFDSVSHNSILIAAQRMGVPPPFLGYLSHLYGDAQTTLRIGDHRSDPINVTQGVRQGDPLSVHLFNAVIDWCLSDLDPELGVIVGDTRVNSGAFADDIALIARTPRGVQSLLDDMAVQLRLCGLEVSAGLDGKSASLRIDVDGRKKKWTVNPRHHLTVFGTPIPAITITQIQNYLGVPLSPMTTRADVADRLNSGLDNISAAPLKPQQRLFILKIHLIPTLYHQLVLTGTTKKYLSWLDRKTRSAVRSWFRLPHDTPKAYFHSNIVDGGLGIPILEHTIPLLKYNRIARLFSNQDPVVKALLTTTGAASILGPQMEPSVYRGVRVDTKEGLRALLGESLHSSVDGRGLIHSAQVPQQYQWIDNPAGPLSGANYIGAVKVRGNLLYTAIRAARGRPATNIGCDACGRPESLGHILQVCPRTHASRIGRHNRILDIVESSATKVGWTSLREPAISTTAGLRRPDLILYHPEWDIHLIDVTVVADYSDLDTAHQRKASYYDTPDIRHWVSANISTKPMVFSSVTINWRGNICASSARTLIQDLKLRKSILSLLSMVTLERGLWIYQHFKRSTYAVRAE